MREHHRSNIPPFHDNTALLTRAALLGHQKASVTSKYTHHADAVLLAAADAVSARISELMGDAGAIPAVAPFPKAPT